MLNLIDVARGIHSWLSSLQIKQRWIEARVENDTLAFQLTHPHLGEISVTQSLPNERIFRTHGIALELVSRKPNYARLNVYDLGGIWDPVDGHVPGEHYATSHFALLSSILYQETEDRRFLNDAHLAFEFHRRTSPDEYRFSNWMYHWDFQNYSLIDCYARLKPHMDSRKAASWAATLRSWRANSRNKLSNWAAMRALAYYQRYREFGSLIDLFRFVQNRAIAFGEQHRDGCIDDEINVSRPIQYHIYSMALLHRLYQASKNDSLRQPFLDGIDFFMPFVDPDGDFNYWGRGQEQIFGYGVAIYALTAAYKLTGRTSYMNTADRILDYLLRFRTAEHFPLVLNQHDDEKHVGWYDYHHKTVYNAFLGVWLALAHELRENTRQSVSLSHETSGKGTDKFAFISNERFFVAIGKGLPHYSSEAGLTPCHLWVRGAGTLFSCPGGATPDAFGRFYSHENVKENMIAPLAVTANGSLLSAVGKSSTITRSREDEIETILNYGPFVVKRKLYFEDGTLVIEDRFEFSEDRELAELRFMSFPVLTDKFGCEIQGNAITLTCDDDTIQIYCHSDLGTTILEEFGSVKAAKGVTRIVGARVRNYKSVKGSHAKSILRIMGDWRTQAESGEQLAVEQAQG